MVWLLTLILGLPLLQQPVTSLGSNSTQPISHNNLSIQAIGDFPKNLPASHNTSWIEERVDNRFTKDLLLPLLPNSSINEGSGEGSGLQQSLEIMLPSTGLLEMDMLIPDGAEKQDFDMQELGAHPAPPTPLKLTQHIDEDDQDIILENNNSASDQAASTMAVQLTTHIHTHINNNERLNKDQPLLTTIKPITETNSTGKSPVNIYLVTFSIDIEVNNKEDMEASQETEYVTSTQNLSSATKPEMLGNNGTLVTQSGSIQGFLDLTVGEERYGTNHPPAATPPLQTGKERREETTSDLPVGSSSTTPSVLQATNRATDYSKNKDDEKPKWFGSLFGLLTEHNLSDVIGAASGAVSENTVRFGRLLIGGQSTVSNNDESDGSQSNEEVRLLPAKAKLQRLGSSVQCRNDSMILRIPGPRMPPFLVDRGEESPVPLSELPASCGFSLKRVRRDVSLVAPYQGCHVRQQGRSYILPLIIMGEPVQMSCPMSPRLPAVSCFSSGMTVTLGFRADDVKIKVDGLWQPLLLTCTQCSFTLEATAGSLVVTAPFTGSCWEVTDTEWQLPLMYGDREVTLSCPLTQPTISPTMPAVRDPFHFGRPWWYPPYYPGVPATLPPIVPTATTRFQYPIQQHLFPHMNPRPIFDPSIYSKGDPAAPPAQPQHPWYPKFPPMYGFQSPVEVTTPATTTTTPFQYPIQQHLFPHMNPRPIFDPYFYSKGDPAAPPAQQPQHPWYPKFPPMYGFQSLVEVTTPATTTTTPAPYQPQQQYQGYPMYSPLYGYQPIKSFVPPVMEYPFMPQYPKDPVFGTRGP